jgi:hypothetical protein
MWPGTLPTKTLLDASKSVRTRARALPGWSGQRPLAEIWESGRGADFQSPPPPRPVRPPFRSFQVPAAAAAAAAPRNSFIRLKCRLEFTGPTRRFVFLAGLGGRYLHPHFRFRVGRAPRTSGISNLSCAFIKSRASVYLPLFTINADFCL